MTDIVKKIRERDDDCDFRDLNGLLDEAETEIDLSRQALKEVLEHCEERENYWNIAAYDKRQSGKDDNYECGRASEASALADFLRGRFVALKETSPSVDIIPSYQEGSGYTLEQMAKGEHLLDYAADEETRQKIKAHFSSEKRTAGEDDVVSKLPSET